MVRSFRGKGRTHCGTGSSRERHDRASAAPPVRARWRGHAVRAARLGNPAIASFARAADPGVRDQPEDRGEVAEAGLGRGHEDQAEGTPLDGPDRGSGGGGRRLPKARAAAAGRWPLCPAAVHPAADGLGAASLPAAMRHRGATGSSPMATASRVFRMSRAPGPKGRRSSATPSASFTSTSPRCGRPGQAPSFRRHRPHCQGRPRPTRCDG